MSWFSLIQAESSVLHSQHFCSSILTGKFIGEYAVNHILKKCKAYVRIRETVAQFFSNKLSPKIESISPEVTQKLLERVIQGKKFPELFPDLFTHCHNKSADPKFKESTSIALEKVESSKSTMTQLIDHIFDNFLVKDGSAFKSWIDAIEKGEEALKLIAQKALIYSLKPFCNKAIKAGMKVLVKKSVENTIDKACATGISLISVAAIYRLAMGVLSTAAHIYRGTTVITSIHFMQTYLPSPYKLASLLTAVHLTEMGYIFWKSRNMHLKNTELNKEQVKELVIGLVKEPIKKSLQEKTIYKIMNLTFSEEKIENFIILLIKEMIDYHWDKLHQIRILNLPLVT